MRQTFAIFAVVAVASAQHVWDTADQHQDYGYHSDPVYEGSYLDPHYRQYVH
jgi:hypothetical protein